MFNSKNGEIFIPDPALTEADIARTTHLAVAAHQDDIEIMAAEGIVRCFDDPEAFFSGVVMTDGKSSPRSGKYAAMDDEAMVQVRGEEQRRAALMGHYTALITLAYGSQAVKTPTNPEPTVDLFQVFNLTKPRIVYTHNLADKHPTHVAVAVRVIQALRKLTPENRPQWVLGCEVWRDLDWLPDEMKVLLDCSERIDLQKGLIGVYDSQISGGKRYDIAAMGRRAAHATFHQSHQVDAVTHLAYALDMTPLIQDDSLDIIGFINEIMLAFQNEVNTLLRDLV